MGSSFSVLNDTEKPIWVSHGICKVALISSLTGILAVTTLGAGALAFSAGAATATAAAGGVMVGTLEGVALLPAAAGITLAASTVGGLTATAWTTIGTVSGLLAAGTGITAGLTGSHRDKVMSAKKDLETILKDYTRVEPGDKYTASGMVALVLTAYVIYDEGKLATHTCWTGPTPGSNNQYEATEYF